MKRKQKMEQIRYRAGWRREAFTASWHQRVSNTSAWEFKSEPVAVMTTASGSWRIADPPYVIGGHLEAPSVLCRFAIRR